MLLYTLGRAAWTVHAVASDDGESCDVVDLLKSSGRHGTSMLAKLREVVPEKGPYLNEFSEALRDGILEFRKPSGRGGTLRVLYFFAPNRVVVCACGVLKKTKKTPDDLIDRAIAIHKRYEREVAANTVTVQPLPVEIENE